ncbi:hypothetical protein AM609_01520 [Actinomyces sp. oral taxon 414]|uniref:hypothetical protein n=1 Tax=Actinomyces sp. oral taxon 414 TaxID=712122 RepID=UPI0006AF52C0|nr:hypothetical protein [Actinomyces sp. oral taxon 414]ALC98476.1 hypothetical protein AM609_01520 [Actinomyces sp. oral taxon 414]
MMSPTRFRRGCAAVLLAASLALLGACSSSGHGGGASGASGASAGSTASTAASAAARSSSAPGGAPSAAAPGTAPSGAPSGGSAAPTPDGQPGEPGYTQPEADPVPLESPASVADAQVKLAVEAVNVEATVPGEVSGPAVRVKVTATAGSTALDLSGASVTVTYGQDSAPAVMLTSDEQSQTLPDSVAAGGEATGVYDFAVPEGARDQVVVRVYLNSQEPVAVFSGAVS